MVYELSSRPAAGSPGLQPIPFRIPWCSTGIYPRPYAFSLFTNDLSPYLPHRRLIAYADDTQLSDSAKPDEIAENPAGRDYREYTVLFYVQPHENESCQNYLAPRHKSILKNIILSPKHFRTQS